ncbi:S-adenosylmethionine tRNA ribosyltransferase [Rhodococcus qingshengii]|uniref:S-adenosylmethionine tRNA ribosyltransferase n=1 Tax=Rhodococcus qingshengii TaxID=334542 RepID=A0A2A5JFM0_RHOSG|nr:S-adenosylmethionine tRNA ribosyltransferase [Rhodococcus qingshengii]
MEEKELAAKIRELLSARSAESSICPSDVARAAAPDNWRPLMEPVREAARHMVAEGEVQITQGGEVVDPESVRGPIRIRWAR